MQYIISIGIFQAMVAIILLGKNKLRSTADDLLILLVACIATHLTIKFIIFNFVQDTHVRDQMNTFMGYCYGPLLYLYACKVREATFLPASRWFVFLPFIIGAIAYFTVAGVLYFSNVTSGYQLLNLYNEASFWTLQLTDLLFVGLALKNSNSNQDKSKVREQQMIRRIAYCFLSLSLLSIPMYFATQLLGREYMISLLGKDYVLVFRSIIYAILACLCVMIIRYRYVAVYYNSHTDIIEKEENLSSTIIRTEPATMDIEPKPAMGIPVRRAILSKEEQRQVWLSLEEQIKQRKIFVDSELNLDRLAQATGINKYHISETLNSFAQKSFYQYINEYRIAFALNQMQVFHEKSIAINVLSLAYDAGFKAKSSFNRYFKEIKGITPTEYLKSLKQMEGIPGTVAD